MRFLPGRRFSMGWVGGFVIFDLAFMINDFARGLYPLALFMASSAAIMVLLFAVWLNNPLWGLSKEERLDKQRERIQTGEADDDDIIAVALAMHDELGMVGSYLALKRHLTDVRDAARRNH